MKFALAVRSALIAGVLATLLNPLFLIAEALLLYSTGLLTPRQKLFGDNADTFVILGTVGLFIPELIGGLVFGAGFAAIGKGRRIAGAISAAILWSVVPLCWGCFDVMHYLHVKPSMDPPEPNWKQEYFENDVVFPIAWLTKELCTGLIIGYVVGREVARRQKKSRLPTSPERNENVTPNGTPS